MRNAQLSERSEPLWLGKFNENQAPISADRSADIFV